MEKYFSRLYRGSQPEFFEEVRDALAHEKKMFVVTANPETFMRGTTDPAYDALLSRKSTTIVPDGIGIVRAANRLGIPLQGRITGVELVTFLLEEADRQKKSLYLYGAKPEVVESFIRKIGQEYPHIPVCGYHDGYSGDGEEILAGAIEAKADIVLVALGIPRQELLIDKLVGQASKGIFVGVGGSFDVLSGQKRRAPKFFVNHNLEWLYRITREPKRLGRFYRNNIRFMWIARRLKKGEVKHEG